MCLVSSATFFSLYNFSFTSAQLGVVALKTPSVRMGVQRRAVIASSIVCEAHGRLRVARHVCDMVPTLERILRFKIREFAIYQRIPTLLVK
jgi:hypothetical protein